MTEPLRIWDAKNLRWINEPHVPVARNPNPVAPKTDTPATQIPGRGTRAHARMKAYPDTWTAWDDGWSHAYAEMFEQFHRCGLLTEDYDANGLSAIDAMKERFANLESTLAAERASRVQAEEAFTNLRLADQETMTEMLTGSIEQMLEIERLKREAGWVNVKERMPEYDTDVHLWAEGWDQVYVGYWRHSEEWIGRYRPESSKELPDTDPTHWSPFPSKPSVSPEQAEGI